MTASVHSRAVSCATATPEPRLMAWNRTLNESHTMAGLRARGGRIVRWIEARRRRLVAARVLRGPHRRVLDAGCEDGWIAEAFAHDVEVLGLLDIDPAQLTAAKQRIGDRVETFCHDVSDPRCADHVCASGPFDVVVASALLEHLPDPDAALATLVRCLGPSGRLVAFVPADEPILLAKAILRRTRTGFLVRGLSLAPAPGHVRLFDRASFARLLRGHGRVEEIAFDPAVLGYVGVVRARGSS